ncbi:MAG: hypothetical protein U5Q44_04155 [Dehalococcoidia bacterium]|nr:hypothetical protein [Dehalococcoidia bacterium]
MKTPARFSRVKYWSSSAETTSGRSQFLDAVRGARQAVEAVVVVGHRAVPGPPFGDEPQPQWPLLRDGDVEHGPFHAEHLRRTTAAFVDDVLDVQHLGVVRLQPADAIGRTGFFVGHGQEDQVALERHAQALAEQEGHELGHAEPLHVERAAAPDAAVLHDAREGFDVPVVAVHGHHVGVVEHHQRPRRAIPMEHGAQGNAVVAGVVELEGDALRFQDGAQEVAGRAFAARRVAGIDLQIALEDIERFFVGGGPIDLGKGHRGPPAGHRGKATARAWPATGVKLLQTPPFPGRREHTAIGKLFRDDEASPGINALLQDGHAGRAPRDRGCCRLRRHRLQRPGRCRRPG